MVAIIFSPTVIYCFISLDLIFVYYVYILLSDWENIKGAYWISSNIAIAVFNFSLLLPI